LEQWNTINYFDCAKKKMIISKGSEDFETLNTFRRAGMFFLLSNIILFHKYKNENDKEMHVILQW
jgi:hypothetical protein